MRGFLILLVVAVTAALLIPVASATRPVKEFLSLEDSFVLSGNCPFEVQVDVLANNEYSKTFSNGRVLITGKLKVRLTNLESGKSMDANISGQGVVRFHEDGSQTIRAHGHWLFFFQPGELGPGAPGRMFLNSGLVILNAGPEGAEILRRTGHMRNVCAALAS